MEKGSDSLLYIKLLQTIEETCCSTLPFYSSIEVSGYITVEIDGNYRERFVLNELYLADSESSSRSLDVGPVEAPQGCASCRSELTRFNNQVSRIALPKKTIASVNNDESNDSPDPSEVVSSQTDDQCFKPDGHVSNVATVSGQSDLVQPSYRCPDSGNERSTFSDATLGYYVYRTDDYKVWPNCPPPEDKETDQSMCCDNSKCSGNIEHPDGSPQNHPISTSINLREQTEHVRQGSLSKCTDNVLATVVKTEPQDYDDSEYATLRYHLNRPALEASESQFRDRKRNHGFEAFAQEKQARLEFNPCNGNQLQDSKPSINQSQDSHSSDSQSEYCLSTQSVPEDSTQQESSIKKDGLLGDPNFSSNGVQLYSKPKTVRKTSDKVISLVPGKDGLEQIRIAMPLAQGGSSGEQRIDKVKLTKVTPTGNRALTVKEHLSVCRKMAEAVMEPVTNTAGVYNILGASKGSSSLNITRGQGVGPPLSELKKQDDDDDASSISTIRMTRCHANLFQEFLKASLGETRPFYKILPGELDPLLCTFFQDLKKEDGKEYCATYFGNLYLSLERYLRWHKYGFSLTKDEPFKNSQKVIHLKKIALLDLCYEDATLNVLHTAFLDKKTIEMLYSENKLGANYPDSLMNSLCLLLTEKFGIKGPYAHQSLKWGDVELGMTEDSHREVLRYIGPLTTLCSNAVVAAIPDQPSRCPVQLYKVYKGRRPKDNCTANTPFYLTVRAGQNIHKQSCWFTRKPIGVGRLYNIQKNLCTLLAQVPKSEEYASGLTESQDNCDDEDDEDDDDDV